MAIPEVSRRCALIPPFVGAAIAAMLFAPVRHGHRRHSGSRKEAVACAPCTIRPPSIRGGGKQYSIRSWVDKRDQAPLPTGEGLGRGAVSGRNRCATLGFRHEPAPHPALRATFSRREKARVCRRLRSMSTGSTAHLFAPSTPPCR
jgi:hypothetical protein